MKKELSLRHQGRELLHAIVLLSRRIRVRDGGAAARARLERGVVNAVRDLEGLYARGLPRDFLSATHPRPALAVQHVRPARARKTKESL